MKAQFASIKGACFTANMMYVGHYSVAGKCLHPLAIKARGKKTRGRTEGTRQQRTTEKKRRGGKDRKKEERGKRYKKERKKRKT